MHWCPKQLALSVMKAFVACVVLELTLHTVSITSSLNAVFKGDFPG